MFGISNVGRFGPSSSQGSQHFFYGAIFLNLAKGGTNDPAYSSRMREENMQHVCQILLCQGVSVSKDSPAANSGSTQGDRAPPNS